MTKYVAGLTWILMVCGSIAVAIYIYPKPTPVTVTSSGIYRVKMHCSGAVPEVSITSFDKSSDGSLWYRKSEAIIYKGSKCGDDVELDLEFPLSGSPRDPNHID